MRWTVCSVKARKAFGLLHCAFDELDLVRRVTMCFPLLVVRLVKIVLYLRRGFLGIDGWQISLEKKPGCEEELDSADELEISRPRLSSGDEDPSVQLLAAKQGTCPLLCRCRRRNVTASPRLSSSVGPVYRPGHAAVSEDARAW
jgi:hypothetical protein